MEKWIILILIIILVISFLKASRIYLFLKLGLFHTLISIKSPYKVSYFRNFHYICNHNHESWKESLNSK